MAIAVPDWLASRGGGLKQGSDGATWYVLINAQPWYSLAPVPVAGKIGCTIKQTNNGRRFASNDLQATEMDAIRAGLEDHFCGKMLGVPMGCDVCYTNHAEADQDDMDTLLTLLGAAGVTFVMGIPGADDIMLNYQSTSFHDSLYVREVLALKRAPEFEAWLEQMGLADSGGRIISEKPTKALLEYAEGAAA